jgi:mono/diheme cytochrome c family protein
VVALGAALLAAGALLGAGAVAARPAGQDAELGRELYVSFGCAACHGPNAQGLVGPKLAGTALTFDEVLTQLRTPRGLMPAFGPEIVTDDQAFALYAYLLALEGRPLPEPPAGAAPAVEPPAGSPPDEATPVEPEPAPTPTAAQLVAEGEALFTALGCPVCHGPDGQGLVGPAIAGTALTFDEVLTQLRTPRGLMPAFGPEIVTDDQAFALYAYLQALGGNPVPARPGAETVAPAEGEGETPPVGEEEPFRLEAEATPRVEE